MQKASAVFLSRCVFDGMNQAVFNGGVAVAGGKILACGGREELEQWIGGDTTVTDYGDCMIAPGFVDAHVHCDLTSLNESGRQCIDLFRAKSARECVGMIKKYADRNKDFKRIVGMGWDMDNWTDEKLRPSKELLDAAIPDRPVYLFDGCLHTVWCNSKALEEAGVRPDMAVEIGGVGRHENGGLDGLLYESEAFATSFAMATSFDTREITAGIYKKFYDHVASLGITSICGVSALVAPPGENFAEYDAAADLEAAGKLPVRLFLFPSLGTVKNLESWRRVKAKYDSELVTIAGLKQFVDGIIHQKTAYFKKPYASDNTVCGAPFFTRERYADLVAFANAHGFPVRLHAIGDAAVLLAADVFARSQKVNGKPPFYNSIEHANCMDMGDLGKLKELKAMLCVQPQHILNNLPAYENNVGPERASAAYPVGSFLKNGIGIALSSDAPCADMNPFLNIHAAVTRSTLDGAKIGKNRHETISVFQALRAHMFGGACTANAQERIGTLAPGKCADITVLDKNLLAVDVDEIPEARVLLTVSGGRTVYTKL